jgi:hypothetical protein
MKKGLIIGGAVIAVVIAGIIMLYNNKKFLVGRIIKTHGLDDTEDNRAKLMLKSVSDLKAELNN